MPPVSYPEFARLLELHLQRENRTPTWLATELRLSPSTVARWLNDATRPGKSDVIYRIFKVLHVGDTTEQAALLKAAGYEGVEAASVYRGTGATAHLSQVVASPDAPFMTPTLPVHGVVGRDQMLGQIRTSLRVADAGAREVPPVALVGMGGIGKTTLTIAFGRHPDIQTWFPDGVLWVMVGHQPTLRLLLDSWGRALGVDLLPERDEEACVERLRLALYQRRMLLLVDDVWDVRHGNAFLVGGPHCRTLVTTRETKVAQTLATRSRVMRVDLLAPHHSLELLARLAPEVVRTDDETAKRVCERLEHLPLALTLAGRYLANEADVPARMQRFLHELIERRETTLDLIQVDNTKKEQQSLRAILAMSIDRLSHVDQERFAMASVFGGDPSTWELEAAMFVWDCSREQAEATVAQFLQRSLIEWRGDNRYWMHALLWEYAKTMMETLGL